MFSSYVQFSVLVWNRKNTTSVPDPICHYVHYCGVNNSTISSRDSSSAILIYNNTSHLSSFTVGSVETVSLDIFNTFSLAITITCDWPFPGHLPPSFAVCWPKFWLNLIAVHLLAWHGWFCPASNRAKERNQFTHLLFRRLLHTYSSSHISG